MVEYCRNYLHYRMVGPAGSKLETPLSEDMGALLSEQATGAFAESLYYYLLRDVFRETAEWCGHMSSVVGRM